MLYFYYSNKVEALANELSSLLLIDPLPGLLSDQILIESPAMESWLTQTIAKQTGIAANIEYPFPSALLWMVYRSLFPNLLSRSGFDRLPLSLKLYHLLCWLKDEPEIQGLPFSKKVFTSLDKAQLQQSSLGQYCTRLSQHQDIFHLANHIAGLYDQYQIYRPDWLGIWEKKKHMFAGAGLEQDIELWQQSLWCWLNEQSGSGQVENETVTEAHADLNRADIFAKACSVLEQLQDESLIEQLKAKLPRLHCFALSNLPQTYLEVFQKLSRWIDIHFYVLNPSIEYWQDSLSRYQLRKQDVVTDDQYSSNAFLALLAQEPKAYLNQLLSLDQTNSKSLFVDVQSKNLLHQVQNTLTKLEPASSQYKFQLEDQSLTVHSCHNALREVEVLYDYILQAMNDISDLRLADVAIIVPDIDEYAPYIQTVFNRSFDVHGQAAQTLSLKVAEKTIQNIHRLEHAVLSMLKLVGSSYSFSDIKAFINLPAVYLKFGLEENDLELVERLLRETRLHGGIARASQELYLADFSLQQVKDKLLKSFYSSDLVDISEPALNIYPLHIEQDRARVAAALIAFIDQFIKVQQRLQSVEADAIDVRGWVARLLQVSERLFLENEDNSQQWQLYRDSLQELIEYHELLQIDEGASASSQNVSIAPSLHFSAFVSLLDQHLSAAQQTVFFNPQIINAASFLPFQHVPFKFIAILGLNDGQFPKLTPQDPFDLMQRYPREGDRHKDAVQRNQFLQAILSCRQRLHLSYQGRNQYDNTEQFPSLLLTELMQFINQSFSLDTDDSKPVSKYLIKQHGLQSFSENYLTLENGFFTYNQTELEKFEALQSFYKHSSTVKTFYTSDALRSQCRDINLNLSLEQLVKGLCNTSYLYLSQLGVRLDSFKLDDNDIEAFSMDGLSRYQLLQFMMTHSNSILSDQTEDYQLWLQRFIENEWLPQGEFAVNSFSELRTQFKGMFSALQDTYFLDISEQDIHALNIEWDSKRKSKDNISEVQNKNFTLAAQLPLLMFENNHCRGQITHTVNSFRGKHILEAWLSHLLLACHSSENLQGKNTYLLSRDQLICFKPIQLEQAETFLISIMQTYLEGQNELQPLFIDSAYEAFKAFDKAQKSSRARKSPEDAAIDAFTNKLTSHPQGYSEMEDAYHQYAYRGFSIDIEAAYQLSFDCILTMSEYMEIVDVKG